MAAGDLSLQGVCFCDALSQLAVRSWVGARFPQETIPPGERLYFLNYSESVGSDTPGNVAAFNVAWSIEPATFGNVLVSGTTLSPFLIRSGADPYVIAPTNGAFMQLTVPGAYVFTIDVITGFFGVGPMPANTPWVLQSFTPDANYDITLNEIRRFGTAGNIRIGAQATRHFTNWLSPARMNSILLADLQALSSYDATFVDSNYPTVGWLPQTGATEIRLSDTTLSGPYRREKGGMLQAEGDETLIERGLSYSVQPTGTRSRGYAGRFISPITDASIPAFWPRPAFLERSVVVLPGNHSIETKNLEPLNTPRLDCQNVDIECPILSSGYAIEPPSDNNRRIVFFPNRPCP